eukprot:840150-Karenia_brevis.AAC.1
MVGRLADKSRFPDMRRLQELRDETVEHKWLSSIDPMESLTLSEEDFTLAVQLRLGAHILPEPFVCPECGRLADTKLSHSSCCAKAERTKGHYMMVRSCQQFIAQADAHAEMEVRGLSVVEPTSRPGDIFTTAAVPNRDAAIDVTIAAPEAADAGMDCVARAFARKVDRYRDVVVEWRGTNRTFQPMVWSAEGRAHVNRVRMMTYAAQLIARKTNSDQKQVLRRWQLEVAVLLAMRRARLARRCMPTEDGRSRLIEKGDL